ncbi:MAG: HAMP domain-containing protein [Clostridia bacterium]|nr:HAMP domain-containing protein [Clostridia bacterium]
MKNNQNNIHHNNKENSNPKKRLLKIIYLPVELIKLLHKLLSEKLEFSIGFRLSLNYLRIFLKAMILAGLGVYLVFGGMKIFNAVADDYTALETFLKKEFEANTEKIEHIAENPGLKSDLKTFSQKQDLPLLIFDQNENLMFSTKEELAPYGCPKLIGFVRTQENIYLAINTNRLNSLDFTGFLAPLPFHLSVQLVIFSDIGKEIRETVYLAKIILAVFPVIIFFSIISIFFIGRGIFQPIKEMTQTVKDISAKNLNVRLNVSGAKDELKELALTFNEMMNRIEDNYNRQKQFVSDASHELRTPIAVIQGYANMLDRWGKNDREVLQESIEAIKNEAENMKELIDKLLFLARHDKDNFVLQKEDISLTEILHEIARETQIIDNSHKITFNIEREARLHADKNLIKQAIRIFIDNALKYTPPGGEITVTLGREGDYHAISIKDTGIGMTKEELKHIFDRFYRSEKSRTKEKGGHGLGLAIAKIIILGHQGKIRVRSKVNAGSEFTILLKQ